jgi:hypothetical protein
VVPYTVATDMDAPNPDSGEEYFHTNTQLYNTLDDHNRFKIGEEVSEPWNAPPAGATPSMDGFGFTKNQLSWKISDHYPLWVEFSLRSPVP